jgi:hypothetical protein
MMKCITLTCAIFLMAFCSAEKLHAASPEEATFFRGINLGGPSLEIDGRQWLAGNIPAVKVTGGGAFENQSVNLSPHTDQSRARMIRSSRWGSNLNVEVGGLASGWYQVCIYVWEDNHPTTFRLTLSGQTVVDRFNSGKGGTWHRLGPFPVEVKNGKLLIEARDGDANLSGIELWSGQGPLPLTIPSGLVTEPTAEQLAFFESKIRPLLVDRCYECHSAESDELGGNLLLDSRKGLLVGGDTERPVIPGEPEHSLLIRAVTYKDPQLQMPPDDRLADDEIEALRAWVSMGMPDPRDEDTIAVHKERTAIDWEAARDFWSLRPINPSQKPPAVKLSPWPRSDIDRYLLASMEARGLSPTTDADKVTLIRRATYDLIGLPPTPAEIDDFLNDSSDSAFAKVIDRLLDSRHYGERWGRHWLDVVRYSDTAGDNSDFPIPQMVRYRDWVIDAFNRDLPYDEFVRQQLAGDLLPSRSDEERFQKVIATGYIANSRRFGSRVDDYPQHLTIEDTLDNLGRTFLASTINCARCHDHKFDPITAEDYYALYGIFHSTQYPWPGIELDQRQRDLVPLTNEATVRKLRDQKEAETKRLEEAVKQLDRRRKEFADGSSERKDADKAWEKAKAEAEAYRKSPQPFEVAYAVQEGKRIEDAALQVKGNPAKLGPRVPRRFLTVLGGQTLSDQESSSGRLQLAQWIVDPGNPLTMRVIVNRIWLNHFGKGLVPTPNDFGRQGKPPTHPELLDWLAIEFKRSGYSIKSLHRTIMLSRVYQLSSKLSPEVTDIDPTNDLLTAFPQRRLDAEAIRDTILMLGGALDLSPAGAHPFPEQSSWKFTQHNPFKAVYETNHRSVYLMTQRIQRHPFLAIFDGPDASASTAQRPTSTTPLQALYFLNDPGVHAQADRFAQRIMASSTSDAERTTFAFRTAVGRDADDREAAAVLKFLQRAKQQTAPESDLAAWQAMVRVIFRLNEFIYVD